MSLISVYLAILALLILVFFVLLLVRHTVELRRLEKAAFDRRRAELEFYFAQLKDHNKSILK